MNIRHRLEALEAQTGAQNKARAPLLSGEELRAQIESSLGYAPSAEQMRRMFGGDVKALTIEELRAVASIRIPDDD